MKALILALTLLLGASSSPPLLSVADHGLPLYPVRTIVVAQDNGRALLWTTQPFDGVVSWYAARLPGFRRISENTSVSRGEAFLTTASGERRGIAISKQAVLLAIRVLRPKPVVDANGQLDMGNRAPIHVGDLPATSLARYVYPGAERASVEHCSGDCIGYAVNAGFARVEKWYSARVPPDGDLGITWEEPGPIRIVYHRYDIEDRATHLRYTVTVQNAQGTAILLAYGREENSTGRFLADTSSEYDDVQKTLTECQTAPPRTWNVPLYPHSALEGIGSGSQGTSAYLQVGFSTTDSFERVKQWYRARLPGAHEEPVASEYGPARYKLAWGDRTVLVLGGDTSIDALYEGRVKNAQGVLFGPSGGMMDTDNADAMQLNIPMYPNASKKSLFRVHYSSDPPDVQRVEAHFSTLDSFDDVFNWYRTRLPQQSLEDISTGTAVSSAGFFIEDRDGTKIRTLEIYSSVATSIDLRVPCPPL